MIAENPSPDNDTMETLIETNEQLSKAMSQHQRALLQARKSAGLNGGTTPPLQMESGIVPPPGPPPRLSVSSALNRKEVGTTSQVPPPGNYISTGSSGDDDGPRQDPFEDPEESVTKTHNPRFPRDEPVNASAEFNDRLGVEPYHPGFRETRSYVGRQDSSMGKMTMHAAVPEDDPPSPVQERTTAAGSGYGVQSGKKAPVYRY